MIETMTTIQAAHFITEILRYHARSASGWQIRALKRRLGEDASPEGLTPSFRTGVVAEPAL